LIDVPFSQSRAFEEPPNTWKRVKVKDRGNEGNAILYTCPNGHTGRLTGWDIDQMGNVTPSIDCVTNDCNFHDHLHLLDWEP